jgi:hypothetical protein
LANEIRVRCLCPGAFLAELSEQTIRLQPRRRRHHIAVRALAFKWLRILHRCWMDRKPYDEATYLKALQKSGSPLLALIAAPTAPAR